MSLSGNIAANNQFNSVQLLKENELLTIFKDHKISDMVTESFSTNFWRDGELEGVSVVESVLEAEVEDAEVEHVEVEAELVELEEELVEVEEELVEVEVELVEVEEEHVEVEAEHVEVEFLEADFRVLLVNSNKNSGKSESSVKFGTGTASEVVDGPSEGGSALLEVQVDFEAEDWCKNEESDG